MSAGDTTTDLLTKWKIAVGKPATENQLGYAALTWVDMPGAVSLPERDDDYSDISEPTLASGRAEHFNGLADGGSFPVPIKHIESDAGQALILSKKGSNDTMSFQEVDPDGEAHFYFGRVGSVKRREATTETNKGYVATIMVNSARFTGVEV